MPVRFADAGSEKTCTCGNVLDVPRLSELRQLSGMITVYEDDQAISATQKRGRNRLLIVCGLMAFYLLFRLYIYLYPIETLFGKPGRELSFANLVTYLVFLVLFILASLLVWIGRMSAKTLLIISVFFIVYSTYYSKPSYSIEDVLIVTAFLIALIKIKT